MVHIIIKDKGYVRVDESGTKFEDYSDLDLSTSTDQAKYVKGDFVVNDGGDINIRTADVSYSRGINLENAPTPTMNETSVGKGSGENPKVVIIGKLDRKLNADMTTLTLFDQLGMTNGYKELFYGSSSDGWEDIIERLGYADTQNNTYKHFHVRVRNFQIKNTSKDVLTFTLTCELDKRWA